MLPWEHDTPYCSIYATTAIRHLLDKPVAAALIKVHRTFPNLQICVVVGGSVQLKSTRADVTVGAGSFGIGEAMDWGSSAATISIASACRRNTNRLCRASCSFTRSCASGLGGYGSLPICVARGFMDCARVPCIGED